MLNMETKYKYLVAGFAIILFVLPSVIQAERLDNPIEGRDCYGDELFPGQPIYFCMLQGSTDTMEKSFFDYQTMHDFYTPQLKETAWGIGNVQITGKKTIQIGTMEITGNPSYTYTKHI